MILINSFYDILGVLLSLGINKILACFKESG